jgi:hypothetical protein
MRRHFGSYVIAAAAVIVGCGTSEIVSRWRSNEFVFLAPGSRWPASASTFDDRRIPGTVCNDSEYIYIGLRTTNPDVQKLLQREGITWWFDGDGGSKKRFGIHYPLTLPRQRPRPGEGEGDAATAFGERGFNAKSPTELELFTGENEHQRMSLLATGGIDAGFHRERDTLVYELKVPLNAGATHPFGIGARWGAVIGLGAVTSDIRGAADLPIDRPEGEGESEGGFGGRRGGAGRARGGSRPDGGPRTEQVNLWVRVRLAVGQ